MLDPVGQHQSQPKANQPKAEPSSGRLRNRRFKSFHTFQPFNSLKSLETQEIVEDLEAVLEQFQKWPRTYDKKVWSWDATQLRSFSRSRLSSDQQQDPCQQCEDSHSLRGYGETYER
jgi:hypothetical protein